MKLAVHVIAAVVAALGLLFIVGAQGMAARVVVGVVLLVAAVALVAVVRLRPGVIEHRVVQRIDVAGPTKLTRLECPQCGAGVDPSALRSEHGVAILTCPFCHSTHQLQEDVRW